MHVQTKVPWLSSVTHSIAGGQKVDDIVVELGHMVAHEHLSVSVSGPRVLLSHVHPQDGAHDPDDESGKAKKTFSHSSLVSSVELRVVLLPSPVNSAEMKLMALRSLHHTSQFYCVSIKYHQFLIFCELCCL